MNSTCYVLSEMPGSNGKSRQPAGAAGRDGAAMARKSSGWRGDEVMSAGVDGEGDRFEVGSLQTLFKVHPSGGTDSQFAVSADGQRFLIISTVDADSSAITVMTNVEARINGMARSNSLTPSN